MIFGKSGKKNIDKKSKKKVKSEREKRLCVRQQKNAAKELQKVQHLISTVYG